MSTPTGSRTAPHDLMETLIAEQREHDADALVERAAALHDDHLADLPAFLAPIFASRERALALLRFAVKTAPLVTPEQFAVYEMDCAEIDKLIAAGHARSVADARAQLDACTDAIARAGFAADDE